MTMTARMIEAVIAITSLNTDGQLNSKIKRLSDYNLRANTAHRCPHFTLEEICDDEQF
jgi:hypothetical protein